MIYSTQTYLLMSEQLCRAQGDELQHLKLLHADLQREMEILKTRSESIQTLKTEVHHLGRQILQVRPIQPISVSVYTLLLSQKHKIA